MDDADMPTLGVGFAIDLSDAIRDAEHFQQVVDSTEGKTVAAAARMEQATSGMFNASAATAGISSFGNAVSKEAQKSARDFARIEKSGEGLIRNLQRQSDAYGLTREELRRLKVEQLAADATRVGNTDLANRLIAQEAELYDKEFAAMRRNRGEAEALAEDRAMQAQRAEAAAEAESKALREAAHAHQMFEARVRAGVEAMREADIAQKQADAGAHAQSIREAAHAHQMFEATVRAGAKAMRDQDAAEQSLITRTHALKAAIDPAWAAQQRFDTEIAEARSLMASGAITLDDYAKRHWQLQQAMKQSALSMQDQVHASGAAKAGYQQLAMQANDAVTMWSMNAPLMQIFVSQAGQVFQAMVLIADGSADAGKGAQAVAKAAAAAGDDIDGFGGKVSGSGSKLMKLAGFMTGPWGAAAMIASIALVPLIAKMLEMNSAVDDAVDKLKEQAKEQDISRAAQERYESSVEGVSEAIRDGQRATEDLLKSTRSAAIQANADARQKYEEQISIRETTKAQIELNKAVLDGQVARALAGGERGDVAALGIARVQAKLDETKAALDLQDGLIEAARQRINVTNIEMAAEQAAAMTDPTRKIEAYYDRQVEALKRTAIARAKAGEAIDANIVSLGREFAAAERNRQSALKAEADRTSALKQSNNEIGRTITLLEARAIAEKAGGHVTSDQRSFALQKELYDKYLAYKNGTGPWAALAAKPGTSNHEKGLALDVAKGDGMTLAKLVAAYRKAGVRLTEALDEGSHFHVAWAKNKAVETAAKEADKIVETMQAQVQKAYGNAFDLAQDIQKRNLEWGKDDPTWGQADVKRITDEEALRQAGIDNARDALSAYMDALDAVSSQVDRVAGNMRDAFGSVGGAIGSVITVLDEYGRRQAEIEKKRELGLLTTKEDADLRKRAAADQIGFFGDMSASAKGFFKEGSDGYKALAAAEKTFRAIEFALSVKAMAQDAIETATSIANSGAKTAVKAVEAVVSAISSLPFPLNFAAGAATIAALASIGISIAGSFGGGNSLPESNEGKGSVLGDADAKSDSIKRSIDALKEVDTVMLTYSRQMAASLQSIESQIGGFASLVLRTDDVNASGGVDTGFKTNAIGSVLGAAPLLGGLIKSLFGTKTSVVGSGLFGGAQSLDDILSGGFDASYYSDVQKKKKFFGLTTSTKYSTQYADADGELENQFTLILRQFNDAILAAAGPLGASTDEIVQRLGGFVVDIGKIDLQGLTGEEIEEKLTAVFGAAADDMAKSAFPGIERFQAVGEGLFETLVRVASTVESVTSSLTMLGSSASGMSVDLKVALAEQFDSVSDFTSAIDAYFDTYYSKAEQAAARTAQFANVFDSLGLSMPETLAGFRALVEAQDLTTEAGQATYATLLQLAPAFADLQSALNGAKSAADILSERMDLERKLLELQGDTQAIRALDLAKLDESNRALQEQIWAIQDAKEAADAAAQLKDAWTSVGDSIMDEVNRIRGLTDVSGGGSFASLLGQFNAASSAARGGDQDAASALPGLSQALLQAAELAASSRQELDRVQAQTAASLADTYAAIMAAGGSGKVVAEGTVLSAAATAAQATSPSAAANDDLVSGIRALRDEVAQLRSDNNAGHAATAGNTGAIKRKLEDVTAANGGEAISVAGVAA